MQDIAGRTAFVTGGANGIGLGIARAFAKAGAKLALADVDAAALEKAKAELSAQTAVATFSLDVRDRDAFARAADAAEAALGPVTLLFNNAGVAGSIAVNELTYAHWDWVLGINLAGVVNGIQTFVPRMLARGGAAHVVNTASGAGLAPSGTGVLYQTSKYAVVGMSEALAVELAPHGIGVSVLCPGPVATDIIDRTQRSRPGGEPAPRSAEEEAQRRALVAAVKETLAKGAHPDRVGEIVLAGVRANQLYLHTDRVMEASIRARTEALLAAMPKP